MSTTPTSRDRYRIGVAAVSGATTMSALVATGAIAGVVAQDYQHQQLQQQAAASAAAAPVATTGRRSPRPVPAQRITRHRPTRTHVTTRYVTVTSPPVGGGGSVTAPAPAAPAPAPAPAAPAPAPAAPAPAAPAPAPNPAPPPRRLRRRAADHDVFPVG